MACVLNSNENFEMVDSFQSSSIISKPFSIRHLIMPVTYSLLNMHGFLEYNPHLCYCMDELQVLKVLASKCSEDLKLLFKSLIAWRNMISIKPALAFPVGPHVYVAIQVPLLRGVSYGRFSLVHKLPFLVSDVYWGGKHMSSTIRNLDLL